MSTVCSLCHKQVENYMNDILRLFSSVFFPIIQPFVLYIELHNFDVLQELAMHWNVLSSL